MLDYFKDSHFPQQTIYTYSENATYSPTDGFLTTTFELSETLSVWIYQKSALQSILRDKIWDECDLIMVCETPPEKSDLVLYGTEWFKVIYPDDVLYAHLVFIVGLKKTEAPDSSSVVPLDAEVLGDFYGVL